MSFSDTYEKIYSMALTNKSKALCNACFSYMVHNNLASGDTFISVSKCMKEFSFQLLQVGKFLIYKVEYMTAHDARTDITFRTNANKNKQNVENYLVNS